MKKFVIALLVIVVLAGVGYYYGGAEIVRERVSDSGSFVYETDAESAEDCTSYEYFDKDRSVCAYECSTDEECDEIEDSINDELDSWSEGEYADDSAERSEEGDFDMLAEYTVKKGERIDFSAAAQDSIDQEIWRHISAISPNSLSDSYIEKYSVFDDSNSDVLASVDDDDQNGKWRISVNIAGYESSSLRERNLTIIHELGHIVTLNNSQLKNVSESRCEGYFTQEGCAADNTYLGGFVNLFWTKEMIDAAVDENADLYAKSNFVTEYAATNPEEDLAESFAYYVIGGLKTGDRVQDRKVSYFAQFPEIVAMRSQMLEGVTTDIVRARHAR